MNKYDFEQLKEMMLSNDKKPGEGFAKYIISMFAGINKLDVDYFIDYLNGEKDVTLEIDECLTKTLNLPKGFLLDLDKKYKEKENGILC